MTAPDIAAVAKGLTKAQRVVLEKAARNDHVVSVTSEFYNSGGIISCLKPIPHDQYSAFRITPFGLAVRAYLLTQEQ